MCNCPMRKGFETFLGSGSWSPEQEFHALKGVCPFRPVSN